MKETLKLFHENSEISHLCFRLALLHSLYYLIFLSLPCSSLGTIFDAVVTKNGKLFSVNHSSDVFVLVDFNVHHT